MKSEHQHSRIFKTWIEASKNEKTTAGENYTALRAKAYIPINEKSNRLICGIKAGIKKETSISCSMGRLVCSICSADLRSGGCKHRKGEVYNGRVCHTVLENPLDAYEFSFVAVPAQPRAGVTKAAHTDDTRFVKQAACGEITLSKSAFTQLNAEIQRLEQLKKDGEFYREELKAKVARLAVMAVPELGGCELDSVYDTLSTKQLLRLRDAFSVSAARHYPLKPQLGTAAAEYHTDNNEFKI